MHEKIKYEIREAMKEGFKIIDRFLFGLGVLWVFCTIVFLLYKIYNLEKKIDNFINHENIKECEK